MEEERLQEFAEGPCFLGMAPTSQNALTRVPAGNLYGTLYLLSSLGASF